MSVRWVWTLCVLSACVDVADDGLPDDQGEGAVEGVNGDNPVLAIESGVPVKGAGPSQQWEGVVMTMRPVSATQASTCTASFITAQHLMTAAHCYDKDGAQSISVRAPTWNGNKWVAFPKAVVKRASAGPTYNTDIAIVDLGAPQEWATPERRFRLFAGKPTPADLHIYGYGGRNERTPDINGTLRAAPGNATVRIIPGTNGYLTSLAATARVCVGDSGGPAIREGTQAVIWGINRSFTSGLRGLIGPQPVCPTIGATMQFTDVSANLGFVEKSLGTACTRMDVDGQQTAQCW